jgi:two-component system NtrC family response regulator
MIDKTKEAAFGLLFVDDERSILTSLKRTFIDENYRLFFASSGEKALELLENEDIHCAVIDLKMPGMGGHDLLRRIKASFTDVKVIILSAYGNISEAVEAIQFGATDFIEKPFVPESLTARIRQQFHQWILEIENKSLKQQVGYRFRFQKMIGTSDRMLKLKKMIAQIGALDTTVLIQGETGTGKELVARSIQYNSTRTQNPFVAVDCASISESMFEAELFGHMKGAFTGANTSTKGIIRSADQGTLFFDEIGELPLKMQAKLLRVLQEREVRSVGATTPVKVDIRVLAATNRDLKEEVREGRFREDLYYRLEAITIHVPPLRERIDDIPDLVRFFISKHTLESTSMKEFSSDALATFESYHWPGNVRELENFVRRTIALSKRQVVENADLPDSICPKPKFLEPAGDSLEAYEKVAIENALKKAGFHRKKAAEILKIGEATLYRKIKRFWPDGMNE